MSSIRSTSLAVLAAGTLTAALATPALAATQTVTPKAPRQLTQSIERHENHALHGALTHSGRSNASETSTNWSGYAATGSSGAFTSVTTSWTQPTVTCGSATTYSSFWVGLDGDGNDALEQTGTEADCIDGQAVYGAWWEVLPAASTSWDDVTVAGGDKLTATVTYNGSNFVMTLKDSTQGWTKSQTDAGSSDFQNASAEVIAEAPEVDGTVAKLSNFGTAKFTGAKANGSALDGFSPDSITMTNSGGTVRAQPGSLSSGAFSVAWKHA